MSSLPRKKHDALMTVPTRQRMSRPAIARRRVSTMRLPPVYDGGFSLSFAQLRPDDELDSRAHIPDYLDSGSVA